MPNYVAVIISRKHGSKRDRKRSVEVFAECASDAEKLVLSTLKRGERIYDIGGKMSTLMAFEKLNKRRR